MLLTMRRCRVCMQDTCSLANATKAGAVDDTLHARPAPEPTRPRAQAGRTVPATLPARSLSRPPSATRSPVRVCPRPGDWHTHIAESMPRTPASIESCAKGSPPQPAYHSCRGPRTAPRGADPTRRCGCHADTHRLACHLGQARSNLWTPAAPQHLLNDGLSRCAADGRTQWLRYAGPGLALPSLLGAADCCAGHNLPDASGGRIPVGTTDTQKCCAARAASSLGVTQELETWEICRHGNTGL